MLVRINRKIILPPATDEVLMPDFNYKLYRDNYFNYQEIGEIPAEVFEFLASEPEVDEVYRDYFDKMVELQEEYEKNSKESNIDKIITNKMIAETNNYTKKRI